MNSQLAKYVLKSAMTLLSLSILLATSACSDNSKVEAVSDPTAVSEAEATAVEEPEVVESVEATAATTDMPVATDDVVTTKADTSNVVEPELLAVDAGAKLYESNCKVCHANGLLNAPKYGDKAAWSTRITKDKETLYMHSAQGFNKMPAQAVNGITEAQVKASVDYMLVAVS